MKIYYSILSLLILIFIATKSSEINANPATSREPVASASEQRLDDPILTPIQRGSIRLRLKQIANGLTAPNWAMPAPNDPDHLYVSDQDGKLWRINLTTNDKEIFLDFSDLLVPLGVSGSNSFDERGFLGFAFHPQFVENGLLYTYTSEPAGEKSDFSTLPPGASPNHRSVIREWRLDPNNFNQAQANVKEMRVLMTVDQPQFNHNAGALNFGSDGMLYIAFGDGGGADDRDGQDFGGSQMIGHGPNGNGQNTGNPLGKLLRIDPVGNNSNNGQYGIPNDNPFVGSDTALKEIYAYGFRNPFRFSFDPETNFLVLADVGQNDIEEINLVQAGGNYGWGLKEGSFRFEPNGSEPGFVTDAQIAGNFIDPVIQYDHSEGTAVIGGFIYRGKAIPALEGVYLFGDVARTGNGDGRIFYSDGSGILEMDLTEHAQPGFWVLGFGQDIDKELYVLGNMTGIPFETTGAVYKLVPNASFDSDVLEIPAVDVNFDNNHSSTFRARLQLVQDTQPPRFELTQTEQLADRFRGDNASFNQTTGELSIPFVNIRDTSDNISTFAAQLQLIPGLPVLTFELKQFVPVR
ncbi:PQQ-dependent sugar dehydrogenase [Nitrosomonas communis]|uniref:PQQ-dependent sugar dehydrogenase n=1 Tax=Nitrosomonas communis TaxID=44574 RepID=UPI003D29C5FD